MTRAEKRLYLSWARTRRRYGGGQPEPSIPSRFLTEVPRDLFEKIGGESNVPQVDLYAERHSVRESAKRNLYTGKTYNSLDNIAQYFAERGMPLPSGVKPPVGSQSVQPPRAQAPVAAKPSAPPPVSQPRQTSLYPPAVPKPAVKTSAPAAKKNPFGQGSVIVHPKYGRGIVLRREGDGDDAKLTVQFPGYGLKKIVEKYAGIHKDE